MGSGKRSHNGEGRNSKILCK